MSLNAKHACGRAEAAHARARGAPHHMGGCASCLQAACLFHRADEMDIELEDAEADGVNGCSSSEEDGEDEGDEDEEDAE